MHSGDVATAWDIKRGKWMAGRAARRLAVVMVMMAGALLAAALPAGSATAAPVARASVPVARPLPRGDASPLAQFKSPTASFPFQTMTSADGKIVAHFYGQSGDFGGKLIALAQSRLQAPIQTTLGFALLRPVNIYVFRSRSDFLAGSPVRDAEETAALAVPDTSSIYLVMLDTTEDTGIDTLTHELTHIVFHQNEDSDSFQEDYFSFFPNWLDEGLAANDEVLGTARYDLLLTQAIGARTTFDILRDFVWTYPKDPDTNALAYAEAQSFIAYLQASYGAQAFHAFLTGARDGDLTLAAEDAFGAYLPTLEARWQADTGLPTTAQAVGYVPSLPVVQPYHPIAPSATALRSAPTHAEWPSQATGWIAFVAVLIALAFCFLAGEWQRQRRRARWSAGPPGSGLISFPAGGSLAAPSWLASGSPGASSLPSVAATEPPALPPPPPGYEDAETLHAGAPPAPSVTTMSAPKPPHISLRQRSRPRWFDAPALVIPLVVAVAAGVARVLLDPAHEWRNGYLAAGVVGAVCAVILALVTLRALPSSGLPAHRVMALLAVALLVGGALVGAAPAGHAQAARYEDQGAYTLALRLYADAGEGHAQTVADLSRTHLEWAAVALSQQDFTTATAQLRAAI
ncbi:MAG TPA: peptidase MA family metallohydrolase, partial [Ktedonobacterales bacterium]|nr:peptidase MA family metallohydrolase [Ktedonobacterales bacterium]